MQEQDYIFIGKFKSGRVAAKPSTESQSAMPPTLARDVSHSKSQKCLAWIRWVRRFFAFRLTKHDLNLEKFQYLESKRTRHQMERNRIHRYF
jgi:hypothetical protein